MELESDQNTTQVLANISRVPKEIRNSDNANHVKNSVILKNFQSNIFILLHFLT